MAKVSIVFKNPAGCGHREVINVPDGEKDPKKADAVVRRIRELQKELDCEIVAVSVEKGK